MGIGHFLNHRVTVLRQAPTVDELGDAVRDDYGHQLSETQTVATVAAGIQPKSAREVAALHEAGAIVGNITIYLLPRDLTTADALYHDPASCPLSVDLPEATYNLVAIRNAAGVGHHLEIDALLVQDPSPAIAVGAGAGSGS